MKPRHQHYDIIVIGGGPAGSTAGAFLARDGYRVVILEAGRHPRHHIGESLLPASMPVLAELGLDAAFMLARYQRKYGARFFDPLSGRLETFAFGSPTEKIPPSFQVDREDFDTQLKNVAVQFGCEFVEDCPVVRADPQQLPVRVSLADGAEITGDFLIDATGAAALLARQQRQVEMLPDFGRLAIYNYVDGLPVVHTDERVFLTMHLVEHGWVWLIPLRGERTSVGVVLKKSGLKPGRTPQQHFEAAISESPGLAERLRPLTPLHPYRAAAGYSYRCQPQRGRHHIQVGDAMGFLDPIFSSGVHLALISARRGAEAVAACLENNSPEPLEAYRRHIGEGLQVFEAFIRRFYQRDLVRNLFFAAHQPPRMRSAVTSMLGGHVWDKTNPLVASLGRTAEASPAGSPATAPVSASSSG